MKFYLEEWDTKHRFGPASEEHLAQMEEALRRGSPFFLYPYFGYMLKMVVKKVEAESSKGPGPKLPTRTVSRS